MIGWDKTIYGVEKMVFKRYGLKGDVAAAVLVAALLLGLYTRQLLDLGGQREAESAAEIAATEQAWPDLALIRDAALFSAPQAGGGEASPSAGVSKLQGIFHNADARGESLACLSCHTTTV